MKVPSDSLALVGLFVVYLLPTILMSTSFVLIIHMLNLELPFSTLQVYAIYAASCWISFLTMLPLLRKQGLRLKDIGYRGTIDLQAIGIVVLFFLTGLAVLALLSLALDYVGIYWSSGLEIEIASAIDAGLLVFTLLVTSPIIEDTFYRAYSITILQRKLGNWWVAGLLSCFMFALVYLPFWGVRGSIPVFVGPVVNGSFPMEKKHLSMSPHACGKQRVHVCIVANAGLN